MNRFDTFLYKVLRYGLFFTAFVPLIIFRNFWSPFYFGKVVVFRTLIEILIVAYIPLAIKYPQFRPPNPVLGIKYLVSGIKKKFGTFNSKIQNTPAKSDLVGHGKIQNTIFLAFTLFAISYAISTFLGVSPYTSFWGEFERMGGLFSFLHYYALFVLLISVFRKTDMIMLLKLSVFVSVVSVLYGFTQKFNVKEIVGAEERIRILGTIGNPAQFAGYLIFNIYFALFLLLQEKKRYARYFYKGAIIIGSIAVFMTSVRGAMLALFSTLLIFSFFYFYKRPRVSGLPGTKQNIILASFFLIAVFMITIVFVFRDAPLIKDIRQLNRITHTSLNERSVQTRLSAWGEAIEGIKERPFFGWGPDNFTAVFSKYYNASVYQGVRSEHIFDRAHNIFFDVTTDQGLIGLAAFIFLWVTVLFSITYVGINNKYVLFLLVGAYFIHTFFIFDLIPAHIMLVFLMSLVLVLGQKDDQGKFPIQSQSVATRLKTNNSYPKKIQGLIIFLALLSVMGFVAFRFNIQLAMANFYSTRGFVFLTRGKYDEGLVFLKRALNLPIHPRTTIRRKFSEAYLSAIYDKPLPKHVVKENIQEELLFLVKEFDDEIEKDDKEFVSYIYAAKLSQALGTVVDKKFFNEAEDYLKRAIIVAPTMPNVYQDLAFLHNRKGEDANALKYSRIAYELNPDYPESQYLYGRALISHGQNIHDDAIEKQGAENAIEAVIRGHTLSDDLRWLSAYLEKKKDYQNLIKIYSALASRNLSFNAQLSYSYLLAGDKETAKLTADKAMEFGKLPKSHYGILATIYKALGDNKKRTEALDKSGAFETQRVK